jgi:capsid portal protein
MITSTKEMERNMIIKCACCNKGRIQMFSHIEGGICFSCEGNGFVEVEDSEEAVSQVGRRVGKAYSRIVNSELAIERLTGYEQGYLSAVKRLKSEIRKDQQLIQEIEVYAPSIVESEYLKSRDIY